MKRFFICLFALVSAAAAAPQAQQPFTFKVSTEVVLVNASVRDSAGNFIRDLKMDDFSITEDGKPQKIVSMDIENTDAQITNDEQLPNLFGNLNKASVPGEPVQKPEVIAKEMFKDRRMIILFFDVSSMQPEEIKRAEESAQHYLDTQMKPADVVCVISLANSLQLVQDFTSDRDLLNTAVQSFNPQSATGFDTGDTGAAAAETGVTDDTFTADDTEFNVFNADKRLDALKSVAETLTGIEQKKSLIYFSSGLSQTGVENQSELRAVTNAASRANMSFYTIDVRGLQAMTPGGGSAGGGRGGSGGGRNGGSSTFNGRSVTSAFDTNLASQETLVTLAADTGGKAFLDTNDFAPAFSKVQDDTSTYYVLGYASTNENKDGRYRNIRVTLKRKDAKIENVRKGYYAEADFQHSTKETKEQQLQEQMDSSLPSTDLPVFLSTGYFRISDLKYFVPVSVVVPGSAIPLSHESDQDKATIDIMGVARDERARVPFGQIRQTVKYAGQDVKRKNVQYDAAFELPPGTYNVKFVLRENQSGMIGSFETNVVVPNLKEAPMKISSVIASSQKQSAKAQKDDPLIRNGTQLVPSVTHVFTTDQHLFLYYEVYEAGHPADAAAGEKGGHSHADQRDVLQGNHKGI